MLKKLMWFCSDELQRTGRYLLEGYNALRELDESVLATAVLFLRGR